MDQQSRALAAREHPTECRHQGGAVDYTKTGIATRRMRRKQAQFLRAYREQGLLGQSCALVGITVDRVHQWKREDPLFLAHFESAQAAVLSKLEQEAWHRATVGDKMPLVSMGKVVTKVRKKSDKLLELLLRANGPDKYGRGQQSGVEIKKNEDGSATIKAYVGVDLDAI